VASGTTNVRLETGWRVQLQEAGGGDDDGHPWQRLLLARSQDRAITRTIVAGGGVVGSIGSWEVEGERDVGFLIGRDHWGNGYATAALRAFLDVELHRPLHAHVADHNVGSRRVLEKCGFLLDHSAQEEDVLEHVLVLSD